MWILWAAFLIVILALVGWLSVGAAAADRLTVPEVVFDESRTPESYGMTYQDIEFLSQDGKTKLAGWFIPSASNEQAVIFVHGRNASRTAAYGDAPDEQGNQAVPGRLLEFTAALHRAGFSVLLFDLRGHGKSGEGRFSFGVNERQDVLAAIDWLLAHGYQPGKIGMMGLSLGAASSVGAAAEEPAVGALVIDSCFADLSQMVKAHWVEESGLPLIFVTPTRWMVRLRFGWDMNAVRPVDELAKVPPRPVMIIGCKDDEMIAVSHFEQLSEAAPEAQTWLLEHCTHGRTYNAEPALFEEKVIGFFKDNLK